MCVQDSESAQKAVEELNGTEMFGKTLYVSRLEDVFNMYAYHLLAWALGCRTRIEPAILALNVLRLV